MYWCYVMLVMTKIKLNFETSHGQLAKQLEKTNERLFSFGLDCNLTPDFIPLARSPKEACWVTGGRRGLHSSQVYTTRKSRVWSVRWLPTYCQAVGFNQSTEKCVYVGEKCKKKKNYHGNIFRGPFSCKAACLSSDLSFWESLTWSHKGQDDVVVRTHKFFLFSFF